VVATKLDATTDPAKLDELREFCKERGLEFHAISAPTGEGVQDLVRGMADALDKIPKEEFDDSEVAAETSEDRADFEAYQDGDEMETEEDEPPATEVS
jgi:GTPase involved in cell partitioning and DNA repair